MRSRRKFSEHHLNIDRIKEIISKMQARIFPKGISFAQFKKFLFAVQHIDRYTAKDVKSGRPSRFDRKQLIAGSSILKEIIETETDMRISLHYFISHFLLLLTYPQDIQTAYDLQKINLEEAKILARINRKNLGAEDKRRAVDIRKDLLQSHLKRQGTQKELRQRVNQRIGFTPKAQAAGITFEISLLDQKFDELLEFNEKDATHLLWEEIKAFVFLAKEIDMTLIDEESLLKILDSLSVLRTSLAAYQPKEVKSIKIKF